MDNIIILIIALSGIPISRISMKGFLSFEITRRTQIECEEAFDDACHYKKQ